MLRSMPSFPGLVVSFECGIVVNILGLKRYRKDDRSPAVADVDDSLRLLCDGRFRVVCCSRLAPLKLVGRP